MALIDQIPHLEYTAAPDELEYTAAPRWLACGGVYVVSAAKLVKIGLARCVCARLIGLQVGSPVRLDTVGVIQADTLFDAKTIERFLHERFQGLRTRGEWFIETPTLLAYLRPHMTAWPTHCNHERRTRQARPALSILPEHRKHRDR